MEMQVGEFVHDKDPPVGQRASETDWAGE
jgi:hypothetical protein